MEPEGNTRYKPDVKNLITLSIIMRSKEDYKLSIYFQRAQYSKFLITLLIYVLTSTRPTTRRVMGEEYVQHTRIKGHLGG
jgi:hypothetical protein